jgi:hypothetical protein
VGILDENAWQWHTLAKMYLLAQYIRCTKFGNAVTAWLAENIVSSGSAQPPPSVIRLIYDSATTNCAMRRLVVAAWVWTLECLEEAKLQPNLKDWPIEFYRDLVTGMAKRLVVEDDEPLYCFWEQAINDPSFRGEEIEDKSDRGTGKT